VEFELLGGDNDETRLLRERTTGYSLAIPGRPFIVPAPEGGPRYDVVVKLRDVTAHLGFRIDDLPTSLEPKALAGALATSYANSRAEKPPRVKPLGPHRRPPSTVAGAHAVYPLREIAETTIEQIWIVLHPSPSGVWALYHTTWFRSADVNTFEWGHLRASMVDQHGWDPAHPREVPPSIWPPSEITKPLARLEMTDEAFAVAKWKAENVGSFTPELVIEVGDMMREEVQSDWPPRTEIVEFNTDVVRGKIQRSLQPQAAAVLLRDLDRCHTMHDLRGWAFGCARAVGNRAEVRGRSS
jgi:hypothetical protein